MSLTNFIRRIAEPFSTRQSADISGPKRDLTIKGDKVTFDMTDDRHISMGSRKMVHDPSGTILPKNVMFFGPGQKTSTKASMTSAQSQYMGSDYDAKVTKLHAFENARAKTGWRYVGDVKMIWYERNGSAYAGPFYHPFKPPAGSKVTLERRGGWYRLDLGPRAQLNWRGYVFP